MAKISRSMCFVMVLLLLALSMVGCGNKAETPVDTSTENQTTKEQDEFANISGDIRWTSASLGSTGQVFATGISTIVHDLLPGVNISALTTQGSVENVRLMENKECEFSVINADSAFQAHLGQKPYDKPVEMLTLFTNYQNSVVFVTLKDSGITTMEQLKGKKVSVGPPASGGLALATSVLKYGYDLWDDIDKVYLGYADQAEALKDGSIDAMMAHLNSGNAASYLAELDATSDKIYIVGQDEAAIKKIQENEPFQDSMILKSGSMSNLDRDIIAMTNSQINFARTDIPEDLVYAVIKTFFENASEIDAYHQLGKTLRAESALNGVLKEIPVHPGAAKYYKEKGVWRDDLTVGVVKQ